MTELLGETQVREPAPARSRHRADRRRGRDPGARRPGRRRVGAGLAALLAAAVALPLLWAQPAVRLAVRQTFTEIPADYDELYFTQLPTTAGGQVVVPLTVVQHGTPGPGLRLQVSLTAPSGTVLGTTTVTLAPEPDTPVGTTVRLPLTEPDAEVRVALLGHDQTLHYRLQATASPDPKASTP
ncbi:hypothetical protein [Kitasatospora viridis]|uniref:DUF1616 domain-containing protein n=1 Tax=Kitasatospora viridis TaxID=281105 RepID=A0A561T611_9ACTN|nr:hypothetical protein [Kitasatospora viridis]TWF82547.1 hypothetical protein FHX73_1429 [Kitasatospora viridis]